MTFLLQSKSLLHSNSCIKDRISEYSSFKIIKLWDCRKNESSHDLSLCQPIWHSSESCGVSIRDCLIYIVGWKGVGKSCLLQTQLCNDMLIDELLGRGEGRSKDTTFPHSPISDISPLRSEEVPRRGKRK